MGKKVDVPLEFITPTGRKELFNDGIGYVKSYDFSRANLSNESRIASISSVASICYQSKTALGSESLYNRLMAESGGLPSSSFEFVPMLFDYNKIKKTYGVDFETSHVLKYGEKIDGYLLTNFRAVVYDFENLAIDLRDHFNTEEECAIIAKHFKVFKMKVDMPTFGQAVRHRVNWQVLSRRYVSGTRVPFDFYIAEKMKNVRSFPNLITVEDGYAKTIDNDTEDVITVCLKHYEAALAAGVKPQVARGIIPQCAYTVAWCAMQPKQYDSFINLRSDSHAQWEINQLSDAMKELANG